MSTPVPERVPAAHPAAPAPNAPPWTPLDPALARTLSDARRQLHHAAQLATAAGISYLEPHKDDSHTNLGWLAPLGALTSHEIPSARNVRVGISVQALAVIILDQHGEVSVSLPLNGHTISEAGAWISEKLARLGADPKRFTLKRPFTIPPHPLDDGAVFTAGGSAQLTELAHWFGNAAAVFEEIVASTSGAGAVRCWPHDFDLATLVEVGHHTDQPHTIGIGMEPGDQYYDEPYLYVTMNPSPAAKALIMPLAGGGSWHTRDWVGAVLPGSRLVAHRADQAQEVRVFLKSARAACRMLIEGG
jgi:hypothetical protein